MSDQSKEPAAITILGLDVTPFGSYEQATSWIARRIERREKTFCVAINPEKVYRAFRDPRLHAVLEQAQAGLCDGVGVAMAARMLYRKRIRRCTGCDLFMRLLAQAARKGWGVFLLGAEPEVNHQAADRLTRRYPGLRIVGQRHGYFNDPSPVIDRINASRADLLFVALGSPRQEYFITRHRGQIHVPFVMGVGGSFDVASGRTRRAPNFFRRTGTEFLYRLLREPKRWRRYLALPGFVLDILAESVRTRFGRSGPLTPIT